MPVWAKPTAWWAKTLAPKRKPSATALLQSWRGRALHHSAYFWWKTLICRSCVRRGFPDESFIRSEVPMTKQEVRAAALAKLAVMPTDTLWDVGAGTGSVSVELALAAPKGRVYAVECEPDACELIRKNRAKFHACNLILIEGRAPDVLADLPAPDAVFIGGTKGGMEAVLDEVLGKNPNARICISAIALETLGAAIAALTARGLTAEVTQIAVSRTKPAGRLHLLMANNPIFLITGTRK